jgi:hypothetical protein
LIAFQIKGCQVPELQCTIHYSSGDRSFEGFIGQCVAPLKGKTCFANTFSQEPPCVNFRMLYQLRSSLILLFDSFFTTHFSKTHACRNSRFHIPYQNES